MNEQKVLKNMSRTVAHAYTHVKTPPVKLDLTRVALIPPSVKKVIYNTAVKFGGIFYGSFVTSSQLKNNYRKTTDFDFYLRANKIHPFLSALERIYGNKFTYKLNKYGVYKLIVNDLEVGDMAVFEDLTRTANGKYVLSTAPRATTANKPYVNGNRQRSLEFETQRMIAASAYDLKQTPDVKRTNKDVFSLGCINRALLQKMFEEYRRRPTAELNGLINKLSRDIILFSTDPKIKNLRIDFENELIKSGMVKVRFYSAGQNAQLTALKAKLRSKSFDITKDINNVKAFEPQPINNAKKSTNTKIKAKKRIVRKPAKKDAVLFGGGGGILW